MTFAITVTYCASQLSCHHFCGNILIGSMLITLDVGMTSAVTIGCLDPVQFLSCSASRHCICPASRSRLVWDMRWTLLYISVAFLPLSSAK